MSAMFEVLYQAPVDEAKEASVLEKVAPFGGKLTHRELPCGDEHRTITLTFEFRDRESAEHAEILVRQLGEHTEGVQDY